jgi:beta-lactamase superfamily II metal-dependent hydrolase
MILTAVAVILVLGGGLCYAEEKPAATKTTFTLWQLPNQTHTQMMSYVIQTIHGKLIVIDGGNPGDAPYLRDFIEKRGGKVEAWIISHPHDDHYGAVWEIFEDLGGISVKTVYAALPTLDWMKAYAGEPEVKAYERFMSSVTKAKLTITTLTLGQKFNIDGVRTEVLGVNNPEITANAVNNSSIAWRMEDAHKSILFTGDIGPQAGQKLLASKYAGRLHADYVQMAHHGQNGADEAFYIKVNPTYCLWPAPKWLWDNDNGGGKGSGPWKTLEVRAWMEKLDIKRHYIMPEGLVTIE